METKIASYQEKGVRLQLVRIEVENISKIIYQIRRNRKIITNFSVMYPQDARRKFYKLIGDELLQLRLL